MRIYGRKSSLRQNLCASTADGAAFSVMVGTGETYLPAFVLAVGLGEVMAGLIATVPLLSGAVLQMAVPWLVRRLNSRKKWCICCAAVQIMVFIPLVYAAWVGQITAPAVLFIATMYWAAGMGASPAWNAWMGRTVPSTVRAHFFARRTRVGQIAIVSGLVLGGQVLNRFSDAGDPVRGFALLFLIAGICRLVSGIFLLIQREDTNDHSLERSVSIRQLIERSKHAQGKLIIYMIAVQFVAQLAAPYFTPFMLRQLEMPYDTYVLLLGTAFLARIIALPHIGKVAKRYGAKRVVWLGGLGIAPLSAMWLVTDAVPFLVCIQLLAGVAWASYEMGTFLMLFETIPDDEKTSILTIFNLANALAVVSGSVLGGLLLKHLGAETSAYFTIFVISSIGRLLTLPMLRGIEEKAPPTEMLDFRTLAVRSNAGAIDRPIVSEEQDSEFTPA